uniref:Centromere protein S n=1 Tax=Rhinopithecus roxellana TaxID=61622 RepID=A0A2K6N700_RHIRO
MSSRRGSFLSTKLHCSSCLPCPLYLEKFKPSEKLQEHDTEQNFAKDLETFARHAKRTTINTEDVKLLARRSNSLEAAGIRKSSLLTFLAWWFEWTSQASAGPLIGEEAREVARRQEGAPPQQSARRDRTPCKNFFWKTFSSCK